MLEWMTRRRRMEGGLYFGAPAWSPEAIEGMCPEDNRPGECPTDRLAFRDLLESIGLTQTSAIVPGLLEQVRDLGERRIRALVVNLLPTQPEFAIAQAISHAAADDMAAGLAAIQRAVRARRVIIATDRHDWRTRRQWRAALRNHKALRYLFAKLLNHYPQGESTLLMWALFGKRLAVGKLPTRANRVIVDPVACWGLGRFLRTGQHFDERPVQLFGVEAGGRGIVPRLVMARIGEPVADLCERYGILSADQQILRNGMLAGDEVTAAAAIDAMTESLELRPWPASEIPSACFSCGWCLDVCPTRLNPVNLLELAERAQAGAAVNWEARESLHCVGCGLCSYVCPTRLPLTQEVLKLRARSRTEMARLNPGAPS